MINAEFVFLNKQGEKAYPQYENMPGRVDVEQSTYLSTYVTWYSEGKEYDSMLVDDRLLQAYKD